MKNKCITDNISSGEFNIEGIPDLTDVFKSIESKLYDEVKKKKSKFEKNGFSSDEAEQRAFDSVSEQIASRREMAHFANMKRAETKEKNLDHIKNHARAGGVVNQEKNLLSLIDRNVAGRTSRNIETIADENRRVAFSLLNNDIKGEVSVAKSRMKDETFADDILRAIYNPGDKDTKASKIATSVNKSMEFLGNRLKELTGYKLDNFFPHYHNAAKYKKNKDLYFSEMRNMVDWERTKDGFGDTVGESNEDGIEKFIKTSYENVTSVGNKEVMYDKDFVQSNFGGRKIVFKDADSHLRFNKLFGEDTMPSLFQYIEKTSNKLATVEVLGPNPLHGFRDIKNNLGGAVSQDKMVKFQHLYDQVATGGDVLDITPKGVVVNNIKGAISSNMTLGSGPKNFILDGMNAMKFSGVHNTSSFKFATSYVNNILNLNKGNKQALMDLGYGFDSIAKVFSGKTRKIGSMTQNNMFRKYTNWNYFISGQLKQFTELEATVGALNNSKISGLIDNKTFKQADAEHKGRLTEYGFTEEDWTKLKEIPGIDRGDKAGTYKDFTRIISEGGENADAARKALSLIEFRVSQAAVQPGVSTRATLGLDAKNVAGQLQSTMFSFVSIPLEILSKTTKGIFSGDLGIQEAGGYLTRMLFLSAFYGYLAEQTSSFIKNGQVYGPEHTPKLLAESLVSYNDFGLVSDAIYNSYQYGRSPLQSPLLGTAGKVIRGDVMGVAKDVVPLVNHPATKFASQRFVFDNITRMTNPKRYKRQQKSLEKRYE